MSTLNPSRLAELLRRRNGAAPHQQQLRQLGPARLDAAALARARPQLDRNPILDRVQQLRDARSVFEQPAPALGAPTPRIPLVSPLEVAFSSLPGAPGGRHAG